MSPDYWAYEKDMIENARTLLDSVTSNKLKRSYQDYVANNKYPCSLLTASWYLTRLGFLDSSAIKCLSPGDTYAPAERLINMLPRDYRGVESRALKLIAKSQFAEAADKIQDLFYEVDSGRSLELF